MSDFNERQFMRRTLPSYNDGAVFVFEKVMNKLNVISTDQKFQEDRFNQRIKKLEDENEMLEVKLRHKGSEVAKLDKQFKQKMEQYSELKHERDLLEIQLQAEIRNSNRLGRDVEGLQSTKRQLLDQIDCIKSEHIKEMHKRLERSKKQHS